MNSMIILLFVILVCFNKGDAQSGQCETTLTEDNTKLVIVCQFPGSVSILKSCDIYWNKNNSGVLLAGTAQSKDSGIYIKCELTIPVTNFGPGSHEVYGVFVTSSGASTKSTPTTVTFSTPSVSLSRDCYIPWSTVDNCLLGSEGYCTCSMDSPGYPPGRASWVRAGGAPATQEVNGVSSKLIVRAPVPPSQVKNETFYCCWESALGKERSESFKVLYPIGPTSMSLRKVGGGSTFDLCQGKPNEVTVICEVPESAVYPSPWFHYRVNDSIPVYNWWAGDLDAGIYRYNQTIKVETGGDLSVFCWPANSCTRSVPSPRQTLTIQVREPPRNFPEITINNRIYNGTNLVSAPMIAGTALKVSCRVPGGMPGVQSVTLTCGSRKTTSVGGATTALLPGIVSSKSMNGQTCICKASHVTGCYDKKTSVRLTISAKNGI